LSSFAAQLGEIFSEYHGLNVLDYQLDDEYLPYLLAKEELCCIFLRRRNLLQSVVSTMLAQQSGVWKRYAMGRSTVEAACRWSTRTAVIA